MANTYNGPVDLIDGPGEVIESAVSARLAYRTGGRGDLTSWTGTIGPVANDTSDWILARGVRLPSGQSGDIIPTEVSISSDRSGVRKVAHLQGSGAPPF